MPRYGAYPASVHRRVKPNRRTALIPGSPANRARRRQRQARRAYETAVGWFVCTVAAAGLASAAWMAVAFVIHHH